MFSSVICFPLLFEELQHLVLPGSRQIQERGGAWLKRRSEAGGCCFLQQRNNSTNQQLLATPLFLSFEQILLMKRESVAQVLQCQG